MKQQSEDVLHDAMRVLRDGINSADTEKDKQPMREAVALIEKSILEESVVQ